MPKTTCSKRICSVHAFLPTSQIEYWESPRKHCNAHKGSDSSYQDVAADAASAAAGAATAEVARQLGFQSKTSGLVRNPLNEWHGLLGLAIKGRGLNLPNIVMC